jgi:hypothetical protein
MSKRPPWPGWEPSRQGGAPRTLSTMFAGLRAFWVSPGEVRREAWALGGRHLGEVLIGARLESKAPGLSFRRAILLKAVIRSEGVAAAARARTPQVQPREDVS